jgi:flagellar M-ring protein FliF
VQAAHVHLVLPERPLFSREKVEASASIVLKVRGALEPQQVRAIRHLVATAVNGLKPERVSVIDETGKMLADGATPGDPLSGVSSDERKLAYENRLRTEVEAIVSSVVGPGRARVQINADFDVNRITQTSDKFDPDGRVVRSSQTREEQSATTDNREGTVSVGTELPGGKQQSEGTARGDQNRKTEEIVNYEISRTTKTEVIEAGRVNPVSAAVLVGGIYNKNDKGELAYQPRPKEEIDRIAALVRSAIGFDAKRGGQVEVFNLRFDAGPLAPSDSESVNRGAEDLEAVFDVPVQVSAVLGRAHMEVGRLLKLGPGAVLELDRKVGERSISTSTTGWWRVAKWCLSKTSSA